MHHLHIFFRGCLNSLSRFTVDTHLYSSLSDFLGCLFSGSDNILFNSIIFILTYTCSGIAHHLAIYLRCLALYKILLSGSTFTPTHTIWLNRSGKILNHHDPIFLSRFAQVPLDCHNTTSLLSCWSIVVNFNSVFLKHCCQPNLVNGKQFF